MRQVLPVFVLASLVCVAQSGGEGAAASTPSDIDEDFGEVEEQLCGDVVSTDRVHVPAFSDQHHRLLQLHVRSNLQVRTPVASLPAMGPWAPPAERGPSLESIYRVSLTVDLCEGNKIEDFHARTAQVHFLKFQYTRFKKCAKSAMGCDLFRHSQLGAPQKEKKIRGPWARTQCAHWLRRPWRTAALVGWLVGWLE